MLHGGKLYATFPHGPGKLYYSCRDGRNHLSRLGAPLDAYVEMVLLNYLRGTDIHARLDDGDKVDVGGLHAKREALRARLNQLADMLDNDDIDIEQFQRLTRSTRTKLIDLDDRLAELARRNPVADLLAVGDKLETHWAALSPNMKGKVVAELMTVTVNATPIGVKSVVIDRETGERVINPDHVDIKPKAGM